MDDPRRFEALVLASEGALRTYIAGMGVGRHAVDDIAQEVYIAVWKQGLPEGIEPLRWLKGIARRKAIDQLRSASPRRRLVAELATATAPGAQDVEDVADVAGVEDAGEADRSESSALGALRQCMERLPPADHDLLRRHYHDEESGDAIAKARGIDGSTVRKHLIRLREALEKCISRRLMAENP